MSSEKTVKDVIAELRRRPVTQQEWLSLQDAARYTGYSEQTFSDFVRRGIAPRSVKFSHNARRFRRYEIDAWCERGGPSQYQADGSPQGDRGAGRP
jgi:predicted DNA-binding transcriptional regulator AlpA